MFDSHTACTGKDQGDSRLRAELRHEILLAEMVVVDEEAQNIGLAGTLHRVALCLIAFNQESEQLDGFVLVGCGLRFGSEVEEGDGVLP